MKRIFALLLALLLLAALTGCWPLEEQYPEKPVIYLYPEAETDVTVRLDYAGDLTCTYPAYDGAWRVAAAPDGTLTDEKGFCAVATTEDIAKQDYIRTTGR